MAPNSSVSNRDTPPALLIANAHSRRGHEIEPFVAALARGGLPLRRETCDRREDLGGLIRSLQGEVGSVILGGGDGTMNAAAAALRDTGLPLGILPLGTANDLARTLDIPAEAEAAAAIILAGHTRRLDLGCVNGHPFFNVASLGLSVDITRRLTKLMKRRLGVLAYPVAAAAVLTRASRFHATITADGQEMPVRSMQIAVGNGRHYGGGMVVEADAEIDDGLLDVYSLEPRARWRLLLMARAFRDGHHGKLDEVRTLQGHAVTITTRHPRHVSADGEIVTTTPAHFTLLPKAVTVFAP
jgi:diacylglycerol kinase (ATP)